METRNRNIEHVTSVLATVLLCAASLATFGQAEPVKSRVYNWSELTAVKEETRERRQVLDGSTRDLSQLEIHTSTLQPGMAPHPPHTHADQEELVIVKEGSLEVTIKGKSKVLGPGSIAYAIPGDLHGFENGGATPVTYYILKFKSTGSLMAEWGSAAGGSFMVDWNDVAVSKTERGERRNMFDRATSLFPRFEMHVTTLNEGLKSHEPHQHRAEEIILMIGGNAEMQIGLAHEKADTGAIVFLGSQVLHNLSNIGKGPCQYFAFQWQLEK